jgi:hypothetical protein
MCFVYEDHRHCNCVDRGVIRCRVADSAHAALPIIPGVDWKASDVCDGITYHTAHNLPLCPRHRDSLAQARAQQVAVAAAASLGDYIFVDITLGQRVLATMLLSHLVGLTLPDLSDYLLTETAGEVDATNTGLNTVAGATVPPTPALPAPAHSLTIAPADVAHAGPSSNGSSHDNTGRSSHSSRSGGHYGADAQGVPNAAGALLRAPVGKVAFDQFKLGPCADWLGGESDGSVGGSHGEGNGSAGVRTMGDLRLGDLALGEVLPVRRRRDYEVSRGLNDKLWHRTLREVSMMTWAQVKAMVPEPMRHTFDGGPTEVTLALLAHVALYELGGLA